MIPWEDLLTIMSRLHGWDLSDRAVRVAVFSLYVALLQEVTPPDIRLLIGRGRLLPKLWNRTLRTQDFFSASPAAPQADVVFGNPPWSSRRGTDRPSARWSKEHQLPMPAAKMLGRSFGRPCGMCAKTAWSGSCFRRWGSYTITHRRL